MQTVSVPLIRSFEHEGRYVAAGESITVTPIEAAVLAQRGIVSLTKQTYTHRASVAAPAIEAAPEPAPRGRRRRKAEDTPEDKPKRRYRRRDLTVED